MKHPLINPDSSHYDSTAKSAIEEFEETYSIEELLAWSKLTKAKYDHPARAAKGQVESDKRKSETFSNYMKLLNEIVDTQRSLLQATPQVAYHTLGYNIEY